MLTPLRRVILIALLLFVAGAYIADLTRPEPVRPKGPPSPASIRRKIAQEASSPFSVQIGAQLAQNAAHPLAALQAHLSSGKSIDDPRLLYYLRKAFEHDPAQTRSYLYSQRLALTPEHYAQLVDQSFIAQSPHLARLYVWSLGLFKAEENAMGFRIMLEASRTEFADTQKRIAATSDPELTLWQFVGRGAFKTPDQDGDFVITMPEASNSTKTALLEALMNRWAADPTKALNAAAWMDNTGTDIDLSSVARIEARNAAAHSPEIALRALRQIKDPQLLKTTVQDLVLKYGETQTAQLIRTANSPVSELDYLNSVSDLRGPR